MSDLQLFPCPKCGKPGIHLDPTDLVLFAGLNGTGVGKAKCAYCGWSTDVDQDTVDSVVQMIAAGHFGNGLRELGKLSKEVTGGFLPMYLAGVCEHGLSRFESAVRCYQSAFVAITTHPYPRPGYLVLLSLELRLLQSLVLDRINRSDEANNVFLPLLSLGAEDADAVDQLRLGSEAGKLRVDQFYFTIQVVHLGRLVRRQESADALSQLDRIRDEFFRTTSVKLPPQNALKEVATHSDHQSRYLSNYLRLPLSSPSDVDDSFWASVELLQGSGDINAAQLFLMNLRAICSSVIPSRTNEHACSHFYGQGVRTIGRMTARSFKDPQLIKLACVELEYLASEHIGLVPESEFMWGPEDIDSWLGEVPSNMDDAYWDVVDEAYGDYFAPVGLYTELLEWVNLPEDLREPIKNRIIQLTDSFDGSNHFETGYVLAYRFPWPRIVGKLLEERGDYDRAINYYTGCEDKERCAYLRDGFIDQGLKQKLRELIEPRYHRQAEAYLIVFELELVLREIVQNTLSALPDVNSWWRSTIPKDIRDYAHEQMSKFSENPFLGNEGQTPRLIDFLTLPQLVQIVLEDRNWEEFRPYFREKRAFEGIMVILNAIRNDVAHARFLPEREFSRLKEFSQDILASIRRHSAKSREGG